MSSERIEAALELLRAEYLETPNLLLTAGEAADYWTSLALWPWRFCKRWRIRFFLRSHPTAALACRRTGGEQPKEHRRQRNGPERPICQEKLSNPGQDVSMNPDQYSILTDSSQTPDVGLWHTPTRHLPYSNRRPQNAPIASGSLRRAEPQTASRPRFPIDGTVTSVGILMTVSLSRRRERFEYAREAARYGLRRSNSASAEMPLKAGTTFSSAPARKPWSSRMRSRK